METLVRGPAPFFAPFYSTVKSNGSVCQRGLLHVDKKTALLTM